MDLVFGCFLRGACFSFDFWIIYIEREKRAEVARHYSRVNWNYSPNNLIIAISIIDKNEILVNFATFGNAMMFKQLGKF